jgi:hypothetical protein
MLVPLRVAIVAERAPLTQVQVEEEVVLVSADQRERPTVGRHLANQHAVDPAIEKLEAQPFGFFEILEYEHTLHGWVPLFRSSTHMTDKTMHSLHPCPAEAVFMSYVDAAH